jgi:MFS family permease
MSTPCRGGIARAAVVYLPVGLALFALQLDFFSLSLAMPTISSELGVPVTDLQWLLSGYLLSLGATFVPAGKIGDTIGRRRTLIVGLAIFGVTSLVCGLAPDAPLLIVFRVLQGVGAGLIMPNAFALMGATTLESRRAKIMGLMLGVAGAGTALGPVVGGILASTAGWRWVFFINVPIALIALLGAARLPESYGTEPDTPAARSLRTLDWPGVALVMAGLGLTSVGIDNTSNLGIAAPLTWAPLVVGVALLTVFVVRAMRIPNPLVRPALLANGPFVFLLVAGTALNLGLNVSVFTATLQLQSVEHLNAALAGTVFMLASAGLAVGGPAAGWLTARFGAPLVLSGSLVVGAASVAFVAVAPNMVVYVIALGVSGFCCGMGYAVSQIGVQSLLPAAQAGEGSALLLTFIVSIGAISVVVAGAVVEALSGTPTAASLEVVLLGLAAFLAVTGVVTLATALRHRSA